MKLADSIESKGLSIVGKLLTIKEKSQTYLATLEQYNQAIKNKITYVDYNDSLSHKDIENGLELITVYIQTYFSSECKEWNDLIEKLRIIGSFNGNVAINYNENINLILKGQTINNKYLNEIDYFITKAKKINDEIDSSAQKMAERIVAKINTSKGFLKDGF